MSKITSIDALIERVKEAFPHWSRNVRHIVGYMEQGQYSAVYDLLSNSEWPRLYETSVSHNLILASVDAKGEVIPEKFAELLETVRYQIMQAGLEPIRQQLQDDFKESYVFTWRRDH